MRSNRMLDLTPEQVVFQTIKSSILKLHELIRELNNQHELLVKKLENRSKKIVDYMNENDTHKKEIVRDIENIQERLENIKRNLDSINDYIREREIQMSMIKRFGEFLKEIPGWLLTLGTVLAAIIAYVIKNYL